MALIFTVPMVQVFINSGAGVAGFDRMPSVLADGVADLAGSASPLFSTFIGGLGAFVAGSNTVSNMMFFSFQFGVGERIGVDPTWVVALQAVGGAARRQHDLCPQRGSGIGSGRSAGPGRTGHPADVSSICLLRRHYRRYRLLDTVVGLDRIHKSWLDYCRYRVRNR
jgi:hypothetical protein